MHMNECVLLSKAWKKHTQNDVYADGKLYPTKKLFNFNIINKVINWKVSRLPLENFWN